MSNREIAAIILDYFNKEEDQIEFVAERPGHDRRYAIDSSFIRRELGWKPTRNFKDAFKETVAWYVNNQKWIDRVREKTGVFNPHIDLWKAHEADKPSHEPEDDPSIELPKAYRTKKVKGVILAGGLGTRLAPLTRITNKHLLPVHNKPMILYPLETLKKSGIDELMVVCGREHAGHFMNFLGSGKEYGVSVSYAIQDTNNGGIADALSYTEDFADEGPIAVILGDNIFEADFAKEVSEFRTGATVFLKEMDNLHRFGVPVFDEKNEKVILIEEKPAEPKSRYAQTGFYIYDETVFAKLKNLKPSARGELEITDVNNIYVEEKILSHSILEGFWSDAGTFESLLRTSNFMAEKGEKVFDYSQVLITGASGMLGSYVDFGLRPDSDELNILDKDSVSEYVRKHAPTAIIHLA